MSQFCEIHPLPIADTRRTSDHMLIVRIMGLALIGLGSWLLPNSFIWELSIREVEGADAWVFVGLALIGAGNYNILRVVAFFTSLPKFIWGMALVSDFRGLALESPKTPNWA